MGRTGAPSPFVLSVAVSLVILAGALEDGTEKGLQYDYYELTCPQAEEIVRRTVLKNYWLNRDLPAGLIRIYFHDCFVRGCDASILLERTPNGTNVEKYSPINGKTLVGTEVIAEAKQILESVCPQTVSCADIIAFAAREAVGIAGLAPYNIPGGRRDGLASDAQEVFSEIPIPSFNVDGLVANFAKKGFSRDEMVVLSGAHSIGGAHCATVADRLYRGTGLKADHSFVEGLKERCPNVEYFRVNRLGEKLPLDAWSSRTLDTSYYRALMDGRGLLHSDQVLAHDRRTRRLVKQMVKHPHRWAEQFTNAMVKLGAVDVLVGIDGEVRTDCRFVN